MAKAIITGSGFESANFGEVVAEHHPESALGQISSVILELNCHSSSGEKLFWLRRHGESGGIAPHRINYRANIHALSELGVTEIISVNTVGGISTQCEAGSFVVPDQIIDCTWGREQTFFDGEFLPLQHIDFTFPFSQAQREKLISSAANLAINVIDGGTCICTQGPRLESAAEIRAYARQGADIVGMTIMPEAALARELGIEYGALCPVVNPAAGLSDEVLNEAAIRQRAMGMLDSAVQWIKQAVS